MRGSVLFLTSIPFLFCAAALFALTGAKRVSDAKNGGAEPGLAKAGGLAH